MRQMPKIRKIPQRTCLGCQAVRQKRELVRIVRTPTGEVLLDPTGKKSGRGAYVCPLRDCLDRAFSGNRLEKALEVSLSPGAREKLRQEILQVSQ